MGIVNRRGESGAGCPGSVIPPASLYTLSEGWGGSRPPEVQYLHLLDHIYSSIRKGISAWLKGVCDWTRLLGQTSQHFTNTFRRLSACRHTDRIQHLIYPRRPHASPTTHLNWTPSCCISVTCALQQSIKH